MRQANKGPKYFFRWKLAELRDAEYIKAKTQAFLEEISDAEDDDSVHDIVSSNERTNEWVQKQDKISAILHKPEKSETPPFETGAIPIMQPKKSHQDDVTSWLAWLVRIRG